MTNILITGFDPFGSESINPSYLAVKNLPDVIDGFKIIKKEIPTIFYKSYEILEKLVQEYKPMVVINVGQAGGRNCISLEKYAYNWIDAKITDNEGNIPASKNIIDKDIEVLETSLPINLMLEAIIKNNITVEISNDPGRFVCNYVMFKMLEISKEYNFISGFIHVPYSFEQSQYKSKDTPYMHLEDITKALELAIKAIINNIK